MGFKNGAVNTLRTCLMYGSAPVEKVNLSHCRTKDQVLQSNSPLGPQACVRLWLRRLVEDGVGRMCQPGQRLRMQGERCFPPGARPRRRASSPTPSSTPFLLTG